MPSTPQFDDDNGLAGIMYQEREFAYIPLQGAGCLVPKWKPAQALVFMYGFVSGDDLNGTVPRPVVVGEETSTLTNDFLHGDDETLYDSSAT